ncbi:hypothetical protein KUTeg_018439 [Tegillarca granosa]|uniref:Anoctamin n=1 Tax=Tegillarca granosa TaxID=220873 RepID=A0ABQ9ELU5_TEGGR|nr:hypothetical protein KUTeg_018439 [Tegillarca granosa]
MNSAYRLFGKKLFKTKGLLVASSQVLKNTVPTSDCDVLVTFPMNTDTSTLMWLLDRLKSRTPELTVHVRHHSNTKGSVFHITATHERLLKGAEELAIRKPIKEEYGGGMKEFSYEDQECFAGVMDEEHFFASQERQSIINHMLNNLRAEKGEQLGNVKFLEGQAIVPLLESKNVISQVFPLHNHDDLVDLRLTWVQAFFRKQPLGKICDYFGVKIAMYFAYLGHYTMALSVPAFLGMVVWFFQGLDEVNDDVWAVVFALFNAFWATLYLEHWKRRSSELAYEWGTMDKKDELLEDPRPLFTGDLVQSPVTEKMDFYYPAWKRNLFRYFVSWPIICLCLCVVFAVMLLIFELQEWVNILVISETIPGFCRFFPKILLAVSIGVLDEVYKKIATWLNEKENYRMEESYENHLIIKLVLFQFVNSFLSLFYIAFYLQDMDRLSEQLAAILITRQVIGNIKESLLPYILWKARLYKVGYEMMSDKSPLTQEQRRKSVNVEAWITDKKNEKQDEEIDQNLDSSSDSESEKRRRTLSQELSLTQAEVESAMKKYEGTFEDYLEMFIQFGYVTLFSSAFPLAALCAIVNNIIEIRSDAFKLCVNHQRPFGQRVENIGTWQDALEVMGVVAVMVNCGLIFVSGQIQRMFTHSTALSALVIIVILEHVILALKFLIAYAIPDVPETIAQKKAKLEYLRREALKKLESQIGQSNSPDVKERIIHHQKSKVDAMCQVGKPNIIP